MWARIYNTDICYDISQFSELRLNPLKVSGRAILPIYSASSELEMALASIMNKLIQMAQLRITNPLELSLSARIYLSNGQLLNPASLRVCLSSLEWLASVGEVTLLRAATLSIDAPKSKSKFAPVFKRWLIGELTLRYFKFTHLLLESSSARGVWRPERACSVLFVCAQSNRNSNSTIDSYKRPPFSAFKTTPAPFSSTLLFQIMFPLLQLQLPLSPEQQIKPDSSHA